MHVKSWVMSALIAALWWPLGLLAQPHPDEPMSIKANVVELDEYSGLFTYQGEVQVEQIVGAERIRLQADKLTLHSSDQGVDKIFASGNPVHYQERGGAQAEVDAVGERFEYSRDTAQIVVSGDARVERAGNVLRGERVIYHLEEQKVTVPATKAESGPSRRGVEAVIVPNSGFFEEQSNGSAEK